jgi:hypothetical protein
VYAADIFVGILNKRFGSPTGIAESGTEEEYNLIEKRWYEKDPKPDILIYFKKLSKEDLADPGEQLNHVLQFKKRISDTVLYKEFEGSDDLAEKIEDALADWLHRQCESTAIVLRETDVDALKTADLEILASLVQHTDVSARVFRLLPDTRRRISNHLQRDWKDTVLLLNTMEKSNRRILLKGFFPSSNI